MTDAVDRAAEVIWETSRRDEATISATGAKIVAQALDDAGLLEDAGCVHDWGSPFEMPEIGWGSVRECADCGAVERIEGGA